MEDGERERIADAFEELMKRLVTNWPVEGPRLTGKRRDMFNLYKEVGEQRFRVAVDEIIKSNPYKSFPTQGEFRYYIPPAPKKPLCGKCDSGWIMVPDYAARSLYGNKTAMSALRCECRRGPGYEKWERRAEWRAGQ